MFQPVPGLISCIGVTGLISCTVVTRRWGLLSHAQNVTSGWPYSGKGNRSRLCQTGFLECVRPEAVVMLLNSAQEVEKGLQSCLPTQ